MPYIYSTISNAQKYQVYQKQKGSGQDRPPRLVAGHVVVEGGANVVNSKHLQTPRGVATQVTDAELKMLKECDAFNRHLEAGYLSIDDKKVDADKAAKNLKPKDESAPVVKGQVKGVKSNAKEAG